MEEIKRCRRCGQDFPKTGEYFGNDKSRPDGLFPYCRICLRQIGRNRPKEETRAASKRYREKYPDRVRESKKRSNAIHIEKDRERKRRYKKNHPDRIKEQNREYDKNNIEKVRARKSRHMRTPEARRKQLESNERRRAMKQGLPATFSMNDWQIAQEYWSNCCAYCGKSDTSNRGLVKEHFIPLSNPSCPGTIAHNILPACFSCNSSKNSRDAHAWLMWRFGENYALARLELIQTYFQWLSNKDMDEPQE